MKTFALHKIFLLRKNAIKIYEKIIENVKILLKAEIFWKLYRIDKMQIFGDYFQWIGYLLPNHIEITKLIKSKSNGRA